MIDNSQDRPFTIGVISPGEMGTAVALLLQSRGHRVVTKVAGRSDRTAIRCRDAGLVALSSLRQVARESNVFISIVPPDQANSIATEYLQSTGEAPAGAIFVEANSIGPESVIAMSEKFRASGIGFVDASINGLAKNLTRGATLFLSGTHAEEVAQLFGDTMRIQLLGQEIGRASTMKMLLGGLSKGICALFLELAIVAHRKGMLSEMLEISGQIYPGVGALIERMLPTYAEHASRRAVEMNELQQMSHSAGVEPCVINAVRRLHEELAKASIPETDETVARLVAHLTAQKFLESPR